ncbi:MAG: c-type cytochrome biogenesis protein CcsB [Planctomycetota bacterium]|nr:c-type cytochrome biogenesis protein CcsB [Planctomycetota bacterium]
MSSIWLDIIIVAYLVAFLAYTAWHMTRKGGFFSVVGGLALTAGSIAAVILFGARWSHTGQPPFTTLFETLLLLAAGMGFLYLGLSLFHDLRGFGLPVALAVLLVTAYATVQEQAAPQLVPALRNSFWLTIHVIFCFLGYGALALSFMAALGCLVSGRGRSSDLALYVVALTLAAVMCTGALVLLFKSGVLTLRSHAGDGTAVQGGARGFSMFDAAVVVAACFTLAGLLWFVMAALDKRWDVSARLAGHIETLAHVCDKSTAIGFGLLGLGIITGAVWAEVAWGRYWGWDPKETSSLITWLVYFVALHLRYMKGWQGTRAYWVSVFGFACVLFTWFGVNYLLGGLHAYL